MQNPEVAGPQTFRATAWLVLVVCFLRAYSAAQTTNGLISGTVLDVRHDSVQGAIVRVTDELNATSQTTQTDENGNFTFPELRSGTYTLSIEKKGFEKFE